VSTPEPIKYKKIINKGKEYGADVCKIVGTAVSFIDNLICLDFLRDNPGNVSFMMGEYGSPSRILSPLFGGLYTYASVGAGKEVARGQISIENLRSIYMLMGVS
jgi:3-dehydroquinate dehydratase/shikimate dehydrogenase